MPISRKGAMLEEESEAFLVINRSSAEQGVPRHQLGLGLARAARGPGAVPSGGRAFSVYGIFRS